MVLSTCNRTEVYGYGQDQDGLRRGIEAILSAKRGEPVSLEGANFYHYREREAVRHLFRVGASLDSLVLGESQILGQVREALRLGQEARQVGRVLGRLFQQAVRVGKRARSETAIGSGTVSVSSVAVNLAAQDFRRTGGQAGLDPRSRGDQRADPVAAGRGRGGKRAGLQPHLPQGGGAGDGLSWHRGRIRGVSLDLSRADILISSTSAPHYHPGPGPGRPKSSPAASGRSS